MSQNNLILGRMEMVSNAPFTSAGAAIAFYNTANPARIKSLNLLEPESHGTAPSPYAPEDLFAAVLLALLAACKNASPEARLSFVLRYIAGRDRESQWAIEDIALFLHRSTKTIYRYLNAIHDELERELIRRELLAPESQEE
jgi:DNA-directed RNA polymerase specialized sigma24 family protein